MEKKNLLMTVGLLGCLAASGCGRNYAGVYQGKQSVTGGVVTAGTTAPSTTSNITLTLTQSSGDTITGNWQTDAGEAGTLTGTASGQGLANVQMVVGGSNAGLYQYGGYYGGNLCNGMTFTGTLIAGNNNRLTGSLVANSSSYCSTGSSRAIDVSK